MHQQRIIRGNVVLPDRILEDGCVIVENGRIVDVTNRATVSPTDDYRGHYVAPGYVDLHIHGHHGADVMDGTPESIRMMARAVLKHGVTSFLPTTVTQSVEATNRAVSAIRHVMDEPFDPAQAHVVGIHLEGPWISKDAKGAQNGEFIADPDPDMVRAVLDHAGNAARLVTIAPELSGASWAMDEFRRRGITVSIGHTTATYEQADAAMSAGAYRVTHCFNAMTGLHHRKPGVVGASLLRDDVFTELIADGIHVHPAVMALMYKVKRADRLALVTDAIVATGMPEGDEYTLGGLRVSVRDGQARLADGSLAGSVLTMDRAVQNMVKLCHAPVHEAVAMASATPADSIGLGGDKGRVAPGYDADFVVLNQDLEPAHTLVFWHGDGSDE